MAAQKLKIHLKKSFMIGDKHTDILAGRATGIPVNILLGSGHPLSSYKISQIDLCFQDLYEAGLFICRNGSSSG